MKKYHILLFIVLAFNSCKTIKEPIDEFHLGTLVVDSFSLPINLPFTKPYGITKIFSDVTTLQILSLNADGKKIRRSWCMCGLPESEIIKYDEQESKESFTAYIDYYKEWGKCRIHTGVGNDSNPRDFTFSTTTTYIELIYKIKLQGDLYAGPYKASFYIKIVE